MSNRLTDKALRRIIGHDSEWVKEFDVNDYLDSGPLIEKLYEEKQLTLAKNFDLEHREEQLSSDNKNLELKNLEFRLQLDEKKRNSFYGSVLSILGALLGSIGTNVATGNPSGWTGWVMIVFAILMEIIAFLMVAR